MHLLCPQASYTFEGTVLENVESTKYLGVTITHDLNWNTHIINICTKAKRTLGFLRRILYSCPQDVTEAAYKGIVLPIQDELEKVQNRATRFVTRNYTREEGSMTGILEQLKWKASRRGGM